MDEELLVENDGCQEVNTVICEEEVIENHQKDYHITLNEDSEDAEEVEEVIENHQKDCYITLNEESEDAEEMKKSPPLYKCNDCDFTTTTTDYLRDHKKDQHTQQQANKEQTMFLHSCISCDFKTNDYGNMMEHSNDNHKPVVAPTTYLSALNEPQIEETEENSLKPISCGECGLCFATYHDAYSHMNTHLTQKDTDFKHCEICNYPCLNTELQSDHMIVAHGFKSYTCNQCPFITHRYIFLWNHVQKIHEDNRKDYSNHIIVTMMEDLQKTITDSLKTFQQTMNDKLEKTMQKQETIDEQFIQQSNNFTACLDQMQKDFSNYNSINFVSQTESRTILTNIQEILAKSGPTDSCKTGEATTAHVDGKAKTAHVDGKVPKSVKNKILFVGSSIGHNLNFPLIEENTNSNISKAKAYTAIEDKVCFYPKKNFKSVVPAELNKDAFKYLFLQGGSLEITNMNTTSILKVDEYKECVKKASEDIFEVATNALQSNPTLEKVVIFDRIPRHDPHNVDPYGLKSELSNYGNKIYRQLKEKSKMKEKIVIGEHSLDFKGNMKEKIYGRENFDGIHMRGPLGFNFYTRSVLNMLTKASLTCATKSQRLNRETTQNSNHPSGKKLSWFPAFRKKFSLIQ